MTILTNLTVNENIKSKRKFCRQSVSYFETLPNFSFATSETMCDYYL